MTMSDDDEFLDIVAIDGNGSVMMRDDLGKMVRVKLSAGRVAALRGCEDAADVMRELAAELAQRSLVH